ncbi:hypothetical protein I7I53_05064 [Histoplasma capsulatum var. duboisii H88]|uniref:Uncharacterized protein n=1 Tax=Ajellomyces capsulatus (strain H88) TaxID=544711 RepID=A0A8A1LX82_AJEC8|nr:hypothetical protein I7I53_05064 [Histoplasma capsulatum var. duboisii H88]
MSYELLMLNYFVGGISLFSKMHKFDISRSFRAFLLFNTSHHIFLWFLLSPAIWITCFPDRLAFGSPQDALRSLFWMLEINNHIPQQLT